MAGSGAKQENKVLAQPSWPDEVYRVLKQAGVRQVGMVLDAGHRLDPHVAALMQATLAVPHPADVRCSSKVNEQAMPASRRARKPPPRARKAKRRARRQDVLNSDTGIERYRAAAPRPSPKRDRPDGVRLRCGATTSPAARA
jgi:hypothetical protein